MRNSICRLAAGKRVALHIALVNLILCLAFSFLVFPRIAASQHLQLDPDDYGKLGYGLWRKHSLSFYPDSTPAISRGPAYPAFIAFTLFVTRGGYPVPVQLGQCILSAVTCLLVFYIGRSLWNRQVAFAAAGLSAIHPLLFWFTSRIWVETLATFLFTGALAAMVAVYSRPTVSRCVLVGSLFGVAALCKSVFLPLMVIAPLLMRHAIGNRLKWRLVAIMLLAGVAVVSPWTVRNWKLTHRFIPVHALTGINCLFGDYMSERFAWDRFSLPELTATAYRKLGEIDQQVAHVSSAERTLAMDSAAMKLCMERYRRDPVFLIRKTWTQALWFWTLGETQKKSIVIGAMQVPLFLAFLIAVLAYRRKRMRSLIGVFAILVVLYYILHLPFHTQNRYSVVLIPIMVLLVTGVLGEQWLAAGGCKGSEQAVKERVEAHSSHP